MALRGVSLSEGERPPFAKMFRNQIWNLKTERDHLIQFIRKPKGIHTLRKIRLRGRTRSLLFSFSASDDSIKGYFLKYYYILSGEQSKFFQIMGIESHAVLVEMPLSVRPIGSD